MPTLPDITRLVWLRNERCGSGRLKEPAGTGDAGEPFFLFLGRAREKGAGALRALHTVV